MKFTKEQQDFLKHCGEHFEVLTGGRGHSKAKEVIEDLQQELDKYKNIVDELEKFLIEQENKSWEDNGAFKDVYDYLQKLKGE